MTSKRLHEHADVRPSRSPDQQVQGLGLFAVPDIRTAPPVAPGSDSSRRAALDLSSPFRRETWRRVMVTLYSVYPTALSREDLAARIGSKESSLCARLAELRPVWVEAVASTCKAQSGLMVDGYRLTLVGKSRCEKALSVGADEATEP